MADHAVYILEDKDRLKKFKENALKRAKEFDLSLILPVYEAYYKEIIERIKSDSLIFNNDPAIQKSPDHIEYRFSL